MDGTFKVTSIPFYQLFSIHSFTNIETERKKIFPRIFILMSGKSDLLHNIAFQLLFQYAYNKNGLLRADCLWANFIMDFDSALIPSVRLNFPLLLCIYGCYYHMCQAIYRHITTLGLSIEYNDDRTGLKVFIKYLYALAFLPEELIMETYTTILSEIPLIFASDERCFLIIYK